MYFALIVSITCFQIEFPLSMIESKSVPAVSADLLYLTITEMTSLG